MTTTQQLGIESIKVYVRQMTGGEIPAHMANMIKELGETKLSKEQCRIICNLMRSSFNLVSEKKI